MLTVAVFMLFVLVFSFFGISYMFFVFMSWILEQFRTR